MGPAMLLHLHHGRRRMVVRHGIEAAECRDGVLRSALRFALWRFPVHETLKKIALVIRQDASA